MSLAAELSREEQRKLAGELVERIGDADAVLTNKARIDEEHYRQLVREAQADYERTCEAYARASDANQGVVLKRYQLKIENIERDMQMKYTTLQTLNTQLQMASAKVQERTPAFTLLKGASVPVKPAGPKRMLFVLGMLIMVTFGGIVYIIKDDIKEALFQSE